MLYLGANFVLVTGVVCVSQAGLGAGALHLGWAAQGDQGLAVTVASGKEKRALHRASPLDLSLLQTSL